MSEVGGGLGNVGQDGRRDGLEDRASALESERAQEGESPSLAELPANNRT